MPLLNFRPHTKTALAVCSALLLSTAVGMTSPVPAKAADDNPVVATVNKDKIYKSDVIQAFRSLPQQIQQQGLDALYTRILDRLVQQAAVIEKGRAEGLAKDPEVQAQVRIIEDRVIHDTYLSRQVEKRIGEDQIKKAYDDFIANNPPQEEVHARHILLKTEEEARDVIKKVAAGEDFAELAKKYSIGPSAAQGGDLGYFTKDRMVKEFADAAFQLKPNQYTADPVKTQYGWHVIMVVDRRTEPVPTLDELRPQIVEQLGRDIAFKISDELVAKAKVQKFDIDGKPLK